MRTSNTIALDLITKAVGKEPELTKEGLGGRSALDKSTLWQVARCADFIAAHCTLTNAYSKDAHSYWLKHRVEEWIDTFSDEREYISNGAFIAAAIGMGIPYKQADRGNCIFALNVYKVRLMKEDERQVNALRASLVEPATTFTCENYCSNGGHPSEEGQVHCLLFLERFSHDYYTSLGQMCSCLFCGNTGDECRADYYGRRGMYENINPHTTEPTIFVKKPLHTNAVVEGTK